MPLKSRWFTAGRPILDLYLLTWAAGWMDALSYIRGGVFTANMTGNSVLLGLAIAGMQRSRALRSGLAIAVFAAGATLGALVLMRRTRGEDWTADLRVGITLEVPFVVLFSVLWAVFPAQGPDWAFPALIATAGCALGIQSVAVRRFKNFGVATTFMTGTLTSAVLSFFEKKQQRASVTHALHEDSRVLLPAMLVLYIFAAGIGGALAMARTPFAPLPAVAALIAVMSRSLLA